MITPNNYITARERYGVPENLPSGVDRAIALLFERAETYASPSRKHAYHVEGCRTFDANKAHSIRPGEVAFARCCARSYTLDVDSLIPVLEELEAHRATLDTLAQPVKAEWFRAEKLAALARSTVSLHRRILKVGVAGIAPASRALFAEIGAVRRSLDPVEITRSMRIAQLARIVIGPARQAGWGSPNWNYRRMDATLYEATTSSDWEASFYGLIANLLEEGKGAKEIVEAAEGDTLMRQRGVCFGGRIYFSEDSLTEEDRAVGALARIEASRFLGELESLERRIKETPRRRIALLSCVTYGDEPLFEHFIGATMLRGARALDVDAFTYAWLCSYEARFVSLVGTGIRSNSVTSSVYSEKLFTLWRRQEYDRDGDLLNGACTPRRTEFLAKAV